MFPSVYSKSHYILLEYIRFQILKCRNNSYLFAYLNVLRVFSQDAIPGEIVAIYKGVGGSKDKTINAQDNNPDK